jgi:hypothetical protein
MVPLVGMLAFSVDIAYIEQVKTELQNAADSAALAGAEMLMNPYVGWQLPGLTNGQLNAILFNGETSARQTAKNYAGYNKAGGVSILLQDADIAFGFTDATGSFTTNLSSSQFPNTIQVTARRDGTGGSQSNNPLALFFGPVLGVSSVNLSATARATIYTGTTNTSNGQGDLLPVAVVVSDWNNFFQNGTGADTDNNSPNGLPQLNIYPGGGGQPGNNGLLSLNGSSAPSQQYYSGTTGWIQAGPSATDISSLVSAGDIPLGSSAQWGVGPGMKSSLLSDFQAVENTPRLLPLYDTSGANGSNAWYHVVALVGVTITYADGNGKANMTIDVQPNAFVDPANIVVSPVPAGTTTSRSFVFTPPKLTY